MEANQANFNPFGDVLLTTADRVAEILSISRSQVYALADREDLEEVRIGDGERAGRRIVVASVFNFIHSGGCERRSHPSPAARAAAGTRRRRGLRTT